VFQVNVETLLCQDDEINIIFMTGSYVRVGLLWPRVLEHILLAAARRRRREASFFFSFFLGGDARMCLFVVAM
jgi:hypothetical protein